MNREDKVKLVEIAKRVNWTSQGELLQFEDQFIGQVFTIKGYDDAIKRYLALGSLPFALVENDSELMHYEEKLRLLWPEDWLDSSRFQFTREGERLPTLPRGNMNPTIMIVGDAPGRGDSPGKFDRTLAYGPSSHTLRKALLYAEVYYSCWFTNLSKSSTPLNEPTTTQDISRYRENLINEMTILQPKLFLLLGKHVDDKFNDMFPGQNTAQIYHPSYINRIGTSIKEYAAMIKQAIMAGKAKN